MTPATWLPTPKPATSARSSASSRSCRVMTPRSRPPASMSGWSRRRRRPDDRKGFDRMVDERFLNSYHNASTPPSPDVPPEIREFMLAADRVLAQAAELARVVARAHQGAAAHLIGEDWAHARKYFSLSEKYADWADYRASATGVGIHATAHTTDRPIRLTDEELRAHPDWRNFGDEVEQHPPMRGWLAVPLIGSDG